MGKAKTKDSKRVSNPHLHARIAFLQRASAHLAGLFCQDLTKNHETNNQPSRNADHAVTQPLGRELATQLRAVARKSQIRLSTVIKSSICKTCDAQLTPGHATTSIENKSRGGTKPAADVKLIVCHACGAVKRFPIGATRQIKKKNREGIKEPPQDQPAQQSDG